MDMNAEHPTGIEEALPAVFQAKLKDMREKYPGCVSVMFPGTRLYQHSNDPDGLANSNVFDVSRLTHPDAGASFTLLPISDITNIVVTTQEPLLFLDDREPNAADYFTKTFFPEDQTPVEGTNRHLSEAGFDGRIERSNSVYVIDTNDHKEDAPNYEVNIFTPALASVSGGISKYEAGLGQQ